MLIVAVVGGLAVLASYVWGFAAHGDQMSAMWGGVPGWLRPVYTAWMFVAAAGWLAMLYHLFSLDPEMVRVESDVAFRVCTGLFVFVLVPSALWLPLTKAMLDAPSEGLWLAIRLCLWTVALASLSVLFMVWVMRPRKPEGRRRLAVYGMIAFCIQTVLLDAILWPIFFDAP